MTQKKSANFSYFVGNIFMFDIGQARPTFFGLRGGGTETTNVTVCWFAK